MVNAMLAPHKGTHDMITIWFRAYGKVYPVECESIAEAQQVWDTMSKHFDMVCTRP
jgi:hypothetical protein